MSSHQVSFFKVANLIIVLAFSRFGLCIWDNDIIFEPSMKQLLIVLLVASIIPQDTKLIKVKLNEVVSIKLPKDFTPMTPEDQAQRVFSYREALALYTSPDRSTEFGANTSLSRFRSDDIQLLKEFYKSNIVNLYTDVEFYSEEIKNIHGRDFAIFSFSSITMDVDANSDGSLNPISKYTYIAYTVANGTTYLFQISTPVRQREAWEPVAIKIMESIKIKG